MNDDKSQFDPRKLLSDLEEQYSAYFIGESYKKPTSRYEAWLMASCFSNLVIVDILQEILGELKGLSERQEIFQKQRELPIIKEKETQQGLQQEDGSKGLRRRRKG